MKVFLIGATGHTGAQIIDIALSRSHDVTALVRSPQKIQRRDSRLRIVQGDPHSVEQLAQELPGHDAVLSALGVRPPQAFRPHWLVEECAASTVAAMAKTGVNRLVLVSAAVLGDGRVRWIHPDCGLWMLKRSVADRKIAALAAGRDLYLGRS